MSQQPLTRKISFSWEKKPGIPKESVNTNGENLIQRENEFLPKLPLPPISSLEGATTPRKLVHDFQIPLPPCAFQPPYYRTSSKKGIWVQDDDPFLAAYKECTKSQKSGKRDKKMSRPGSSSFCESRLVKNMSFFSCKRSCNVRDNNLVRISHSPQNID
ncbi:hypothetical protein MtrunA17_Chr1g0152201 [Medicago truncatula]|uniref:Uncharacterized protein n=1 Tax=Medicago truncatula TaxID=3880 RepID=A0A072VDA7_MEDTR|nr:uncharacterized protein LOC25482045 [Medicago truncatula]KEH39999.1 hypothetical protein MTR_1g017500 [Medicago truncatula]RHN77203.1 hypothetical protein MtrunA17_Chr1g0152201 [Medicago truncatula]